MSQEENEKKRKRGAIMFTTVFHALLMVVFLLVSWKEPFPLPEPIPVEIEFIGGAGMEGGSPANAVSSTEEQPTEKLNTQDDSEVEVPKGNSTVVNNNTTSSNATTNNTQSVNQNALFGGGNGNGEKGNSIGNGTGDGNTTGTSPGNGNGDGTGLATGPGVSMNGRRQVASPKPENPEFERGRVVFTIYVNRKGIVTRAVFDAARSTTNDSKLVSNCKAKLVGSQIVNEDQNAAEEQRGSYVFEFTNE
ncbi:MAG: hypothetical protein K1X56_10830 [Flavobacteriales bacterium]|nr:hypothetical protein [Flavobacteriales bacterium]